MFYMGDVNDCRVDINGVQVRVIADSHSYDKLRLQASKCPSGKFVLKFHMDKGRRLL